MSDADSAAISAVRKDWVSEHRELYLQSGGTQGHIMDITAVGAYSLGAHCLVKCVRIVQPVARAASAHA